MSDEIKWDVIDSYTRQQAIKDGVLIDASKMAEEAGITFPVALTNTLWQEYIVPDKEKYGQSVDGRLWDVLWMFGTAARRTSGNTMLFSLNFVMDREKKLVQLKAIIGPGDDGSPVITIMFPHED